MHSTKNNSKVTATEWHRFRREARTEAFSEEEFSDAERVRFNLNPDGPFPAGVTGEDTDATYIDDNPGPGESPETDIRTEAIR